VVRRLAAIGLIPLAGVALAACYGSTEPATDVKQTSAVLNARGTANNGEAQSFFEYWVTGSTERSTSPAFRWPAGASAPFSWKAEGLISRTQYSFRMCGRDLSGSDFVCAQTRTFTTPAPTEDEVWGGWFSGTVFNGTVRARSGPNGENATGTLHTSTFTGLVTCLLVDGNRAVVGALGDETVSSGTRRASMIMALIDAGPGGTDTAAVAISEFAAPPPCQLAGFGNQQPIPPDDGGFVITDAP
jgi:hypothetical protein